MIIRVLGDQKKNDTFHEKSNSRSTTQDKGYHGPSYMENRYIHRSNNYQRWDNHMPHYDSYNHNKRENKQLRSRVAENDETRRQRHRQHQEDHLKDDEYSLNQCNKSVSGKRCVDHKDNSRRNVANEHSHVVDLTKPMQQTMLANGLSNGLDSSSVVSPDLLK